MKAEAETITISTQLIIYIDKSCPDRLLTLPTKKSVETGENIGRINVGLYVSRGPQNRHTRRGDWPLHYTTVWQAVGSRWLVRYTWPTRREL